jgi:hypothetical protein
MRPVAAALLAAALAAPASAREVAGVEIEEGTTVAGQALALNGAGIRKKFVVKVYVGALYLASPSADPEAIVAADAPKRVRMVFLRDVGRDSILGAFRDGFDANSPDEAAQARADLDKVASAIPDLKKGGEMVVTYAPGEGTTLSAAGGGTATVPGKAFADALLRNWLGKKPADGDLKKAMLGL